MSAVIWVIHVCVKTKQEKKIKPPITLHSRVNYCIHLITFSPHYLKFLLFFYFLFYFEWRLSVLFLLPNENRSFSVCFSPGWAQRLPWCLAAYSCRYSTSADRKTQWHIFTGFIQKVYSLAYKQNRSKTIEQNLKKNKNLCVSFINHKNMSIRGLGWWCLAQKRTTAFSGLFHPLQHILRCE